MFGKTCGGIQGVIKAAIDIDVIVFSSSELFICTSSCYKGPIRFETNLDNLTFLRGDIKRYYERGGLKCKRLRNESTSEIVCTESVRSGGTSAAKSLKIPSATTCASSFGTALLNALELPSLCAPSRQLAQNETGVKVPLSEKWQMACDWSASMNGSEFSLKQTFVGEECVTSPKSVCVGG